MLLRFSLLKFIVFIFILNSCASLKKPSSRQSIYGLTTVGMAGGAFYGFNQTKAKTKNALFYSAGVGLIVSLISIAIFNEEKRAKELEEKLAQLEEEFGLMYEGSKLKYLTGGKSYLTIKDIPKEIKPHINLGEWYLFELEKNQPVEDWTAIGKNRLVKKNKLFELKAPTIKEK